MRKLFKKTVFYFLILLCLMLAVSACLKSAPADNSNQNQPAIQTPPFSNEPDIEEQYELSLSKILQSYWENNNVVGIKDGILSLTAPAEYLDLHFKLVIAFEKIEQGGINFDQEKVAAGRQSLAELKNQYPWLR